MPRISDFALLLCTCLLVALPAEAHTGMPEIGLVSGFLHPITGWDHVVAMVGVGLWGAFLGAPAIWLLPVIFPLVMSLGGALGILGVPLPAIETGIALSGVVLGLAVLVGLRAPLWLAGTVVAIFAICHGYAHGRELPSAANPFAFGIGFVVATGLLHLAGIGLGCLTLIPRGIIIVRTLGLAIACVGFAFLIGAA